MFNIHRKEINWGGRKLVLESGRIARQADGAVLATYGETVVLCTAVARNSQSRGSTSSRSRSTTRKKPSLPARYPAAFSSAKDGRPRRRF
jgi:polyribonucleotide nucleotidyltransferase